MQRNNSDTNKVKNKPKLSPLIITKTTSHKTQNVNSPSPTSDNDQEWKPVDNNKRNRSPNNTSSPHTKKTNEPSNFSSPNRYSPLNIDEDNNMDLGTNTETIESPPPPPPPPPIFLTSPIDFISLCKNLEQITKTEGFLCKSNSKNIKINLHSASSYRAAITLFNENKLEYHTYQTHEEKSYRVVIRNLHHSIPTDYIKEEIEKHGFLVKNVTNIRKSQSKEPLPLFFVDLNPSPNNQDIFMINNICFSKVKFEAPHIRRDLVQCHRCQQYGHTKSYCNHQPKCVRCGESHTSDQCSKPKDLPAKCALCSKDHPANYRGCTVHKDLQRFRKKQQPTTISRLSTENSDTPQVQPDSQPLPGPSHSTNAPARSLNEPSETQHFSPTKTQHLSYSQTVKGNKPNKLKSNHIKDPPSDQLITSQLTTFISEFKTLISPLITLLNPLIALLTSLINKLSTNNGN